MNALKLSTCLLLYAIGSHATRASIYNTTILDVDTTTNTFPSGENAEGPPSVAHEGPEFPECLSPVCYACVGTGIVRFENDGAGSGWEPMSYPEVESLFSPSISGKSFVEKMRPVARDPLEEEVYRVGIESLSVRMPGATSSLLTSKEVPGYSLTSLFLSVSISGEQRWKLRHGQGAEWISGAEFKSPSGDHKLVVVKKGRERYSMYFDIEHAFKCGILTTDQTPERVISFPPQSFIEMKSSSPLSVIAIGVEYAPCGFDSVNTHTFLQLHGQDAHDLTNQVGTAVAVAVCGVICFGVSCACFASCKRSSRGVRDRVPLHRDASKIA